MSGRGDFVRVPCQSKSSSIRPMPSVDEMSLHIPSVLLLGRGAFSTDLVDNNSVTDRGTFPGHQRYRGARRSPAKCIAA